MSKVVKFSYILLFVILSSGVTLYIYIPDTVWAGAGIMAALSSIASLVHIRFLVPSADHQIESTQTWVMLAIAIMGILIIFYNKAMGHSDFYVGMGAGLTLVSAFTFCMVLLIRFDQSVR